MIADWSLPIADVARVQSAIGNPQSEIPNG
jgi:hypothetical protein